MRKWNFCAGPAVISEEVLEEVKSELLEYNNSGTSIMEVSHRSRLYSSVAAEAKQDLIDILNIPKNYDVLFLQGGATHQFSMVPYNFGNSSGEADYILSGSWSKKAISEASKIIKVNTIASSEAKNYSYAPDPKTWKISEKSAYVHYCPNETIQGVAIHEAPNVNKPIISIVVLSVGFLGWIPLMLVLQYFSTAYLLYTFVFKVLTKIPGFTYVQLLYFELITIFPIIDVVLKTVNPFYN